MPKKREYQALKLAKSSPKNHSDICPVFTQNHSDICPVSPKITPKSTAFKLVLVETTVLFKYI